MHGGMHGGVACLLVHSEEVSHRRRLLKRVNAPHAVRQPPRLVHGDSGVVPHHVHPQQHGRLRHLGEGAGGGDGEGEGGGKGEGEGEG